MAHEKNGLQPNDDDAGNSRDIRRVTSAFSLPTSESDSIVQKVLLSLLERIDRGQYKAGERINAQELSRSLGISRAPVREALNILAGQGVVSLLPDKGAVLRPFSPKRLVDAMSALKLLWGASLEEVGPSMTSPQNKETVLRHREIIRSLNKSEIDFRFYISIHDFHFDIIKISENSFYEEMSHTLNPDLLAREFSKHIEVDHNISFYLGTYDRIMDALLSGDGKTARSSFDFHMSWQIDALRKSFDRNKPQKRGNSRKRSS